jgi:hypothetical protein
MCWKIRKLVSTYSDFAKAGREAFPDGVPASTAVSSPELVIPTMLVEIEAIAVIGMSTRSRRARSLKTFQLNNQPNSNFP